MTELDKATRNLDRMSKVALEASKTAVKSAEQLKVDIKKIKMR